MANKKSNNAYEAIKEMRQLLAEWLETSEKASKPVARMMRLLEIVEHKLQSEPSSSATRSRGQQERRYSIEATATGEVLTEGKTGEQSPPFRVPKLVYDQTAEVLGRSPAPLKFEEILEAVSQNAAVPPGEFQIRVCLRFWMSVDPPVVARGKTKYHPVSRSAFSMAAKNAWASLAEK
jgi:hypothetical protein